MNLTILQRHTDCQVCPLHATAKSIGIPTRPSLSHPPTGQLSKAVLIVAGSPGVEEDKQGTSLIDQAGSFAEQVFVSHSKLHEVADVYLTNAVRCYPGNTTVAKQHLSACSQWLIEDLAALRSQYSEVVLLLAGAEAMRQVTGSGLKAFTQGQLLSFGGHEYRVFGTYNPGILLPKNDSSKITAIDSHTKLVHDYCRDGRINYSVEVLEAPHGDEYPDPPLDKIDVLSLDIETYGCIRSYPSQTVFHPLKSIAFDGIPASELVVTVALAWRVGATYASKVYVMSDLKDRHGLRRILEGAVARHVPILGLNLQFDLQYLRVFDGTMRKALSYPDCHVIDLSVVNFLHCDQRPERGLKQMAALFGVYNYSEEKISLKRGEKYESDTDPDLWRYNCIDALATLVLYEAFSGDLKRRFGEDTHKWSAFSQDWFNKLVWLGIEMSENGLAYDRAKLEALHKDSLALMEESLSKGANRNTIIAGTGSEKSMVETLETILQLYMPSDEEQRTAFLKRVAHAPKKKRICINAENVNLLRGVVPVGHLARDLLDWYTQLKDNQKITGTYTQPLLYGKIEKEGKPAKPARYSKADGRLLKEAQPAVPDELSFDSTMIGELCHPQWYVVPTFENSSNEGGTQQGRITSKAPATQTQPWQVKACYKSRFDGGCILSVDGSQLEYRIAAALSGDPAMIDTFARDISYHGMTAGLCKGDNSIVPKSDKVWYHAGKTINFLTMFLGTWMKLQETLLRDVGVHLSKQRCQAIIAAFDKRHSVFRAWQRGQIAAARSLGYTELPLTGISRTFLGYIDETYGPTIVNFPVQTTAATCTLSAQMTLWDWLRANNMRTLIIANTYDAIVCDCPPDEVEIVATECLRLMRNPPIYEELIALGKLHRVKLDAEATAQYNNGETIEMKL